MFRCIFPKSTKKSSGPIPNAEQFLPVPQMLAHPMPLTLDNGKKTLSQENKVVCRILKSSIINNDGSVDVIYTDFHPEFATDENICCGGCFTTDIQLSHKFCFSCGGKFDIETSALV